MSTAGIVMMAVSYVAVISLTAFCFFRVLTTRDTEKTEHAPLDIDTHDKDVD